MPERPQRQHDRRRQQQRAVGLVRRADQRLPERRTGRGMPSNGRSSHQAATPEHDLERHRPGHAPGPRGPARGRSALCRSTRQASSAAWPQTAAASRRMDDQGRRRAEVAEPGARRRPGRRPGPASPPRGGAGGPGRAGAGPAVEPVAAGQDAEGDHQREERLRRCSREPRPGSSRSSCTRVAAEHPLDDDRQQREHAQRLQPAAAARPRGTRPPGRSSPARPPRRRAGARARLNTPQAAFQKSYRNMFMPNVVGQSGTAMPTPVRRHRARRRRAAAR